MPLVLVDNLRKHFKETKAVDGVSFSIDSGQTLGLVGESGCGKTTLARVLMNLEKPTAGKACIDGTDIFSMSRQQISEKMRMIFQNPNAALNPQMKVKQILAEAIAVHRGDISRKERSSFARELLKDVRFPIDSIGKYPHQLSGGEKRRAAIARALVAHPKLIVADEPLSGLDVSTAAQILELLMELQREYNVAYLFISHDLNVVSRVSHRIAVMFFGRIVEIGSKDEIMNHPLHPYTQDLLPAVLPVGSSAKSHLRDIAGYLDWDLSEGRGKQAGCRYLARCQRYMALISSDDRARCEKEQPWLVKRGNDHLVSCHF